MVCALFPLLNMIYLAPMSPSPFALRQASSNRPPSVVQSLAPIELNIHYVLEQPEATPPVTSSPQSVLSRAELLSARTTNSFYHYHVGGGSALNSPGPVQHLRNPATPLKPEIILGSPPPANFLHAPSARDPQMPSAYTV